MSSPRPLPHAAGWSLLDLNPRLRVLYSDTQSPAGAKVEAVASAFAETLIREMLDAINNQRLKSQLHAYVFDIVSQQAPKAGSRRRIDFQVRAWTRDRHGHLQPFTLVHVEVKRYGAHPSEVEDLEDQCVTACQNTNQPKVYAMAFHGTAMRIWCMEGNVHRSLLPEDSQHVSGKCLWVDAAQHGQGYGKMLLDALNAIVQLPPYLMVTRDEL